MSTAIEKILAQKTPEPPPAKPESEGDKFFSSLGGVDVREFYLEVKKKDGQQTCLAYEQLTWFNYDPESGFLDLQFGMVSLIIKGRGLNGDLFQALKQRRVSWIKEADSEMQDHQGNSLYIEELILLPPGDEGEREEEEPTGERQQRAQQHQAA